MQAAMIALLAAVATLGPQAAQARSCPADAKKASQTIWPAGTISTGQAVTGTHACGRELTCVGGSLGTTQSRRCRWL